MFVKNTFYPFPATFRPGNFIEKSVFRHMQKKMHANEKLEEWSLYKKVLHEEGVKEVKLINCTFVSGVSRRQREKYGKEGKYEQKFVLRDQNLLLF